MKVLLQSREEWDALISRRNLVRRGKVRSRHQLILTNSCGPKQYPCVAVESTRIFMTEPDEYTYGFVYLEDFVP